MSRVRDRTGEGEEAFAVAWHSDNGDLAWLSPKIPSEEAAQIAADAIASFAGATKR
jgi:protoheme ferro-lyase